MLQSLQARFAEVMQRMTEPALICCPRCQSPICRVLFAPTVVIKGNPPTETDRKIKDYEKEGKWSHAAELADKEAERTKQRGFEEPCLGGLQESGL